MVSVFWKVRVRMLALGEGLVSDRERKDSGTAWPGFYGVFSALDRKTE